MTGQVLNFEKGALIIAEKDPANCAFLILKGTVRVFLKKGTRIVDLAQLGKDEIFGETAIFRGEHYGASVSAASDCSLLVITPESLNATLENADPIVRSIIRMLTTRLQTTNEALLKSETREFMDIALI